MSKQTDLLNLTDAITVDSSNNVGIGTTSPSAPLDIAGTSGTESFRIGSTVGGTDLGITVTENDGVLLNAAEGATGRHMKFATGGTERMRIDSSGRVTMPYQPAFSAYLIQNPAANGYPTSGTYVASSTGIGFTDTSELILRHTRVNIGGHYSTSTGRFTAPVSGTYRFSYSCLPDWDQSSAEAWAEFSLNGSQAYDNHEMYVVNSASNMYVAQMSGSCVFTLSAGDYVSIFQRGGMHQRYTCFSGELIG